jgi:hypothetical protein
MSKINAQQKTLRSYGAVLAVAIALGFLAQFQIMGTIFITIYGVVSIVRRIPSRTTFILAVMSLAVTAVVLLVGRRVIAENFASYSFLLLIVATISLFLEQWRLSRLLRKKHQKL